MKDKIPLQEPKRIITNVILGAMLLVPILLLFYIFFYIISKNPAGYQQSSQDYNPSQASVSENDQSWQKVQSQEAALREATGRSFEQTSRETQRQLDDLDLKRDLRKYTNTLSDTLY
jgi:hypothetical protein